MMIVIYGYYNVYMYYVNVLAIGFEAEIPTEGIQGLDQEVCVSKNASSEVGEGYTIALSVDAVDGTGKIHGVFCGILSTIVHSFTR